MYRCRLGRWSPTHCLLTATIGILLIYLVAMRPYIPRILRASQDDRTTANQIKVYNHEDLQLSGFDVAKINLQFHPAFRNPCFLEHVTHKERWVYWDNKFITTRSYRKRPVLGYNMERYLRSFTHGVLVNDSLCPPDTECRLRCLPYFMLIGAAKSGTSDLANKALSHPQIYGAINKELFYWTNFRFSLNATLGDYSDLFDTSVPEVIKEKKQLNGKDFYPRILSEYTSQTLGDDIYWRESPKNKGLKEPVHLKIHDLYKVNPNVKIIAILRNPTFKLYSSYNMYRRNMLCTPSDFHQRVVASIAWWRNCTEVLGLPVRTCAYSCVPEMPSVLCGFSEEHNDRWGAGAITHSGELLRAMYSVFVKDWLSVFPRHQVLFLRTKDSHNMSRVLNRQVFPFLGLEPVTGQQAPHMYATQHRNTRTYAPMLPHTYSMLSQFYRPFNQQLARLLGDSKWLWEDGTPPELQAT